MRPEKASIVSDLSEKLKGSPFMLVTDYQRMKVDQFGELRNRLAPAGAEVRVVKNSFLKRAMADSGMPDVTDKLVGQTAVVLGENDAAPIAKILKIFAAEFKIAALKVGVIDREIMSSAQVEALADLPSREVLRGQLLGLLLAPATRLVRVLNEPASAFARLLQAKADKGEPAGPTKKVEAPQSEAGAPQSEAGNETTSAEPAAAVSAPEAPAAEVSPIEPKMEATAPETAESEVKPPATEGAE